MNKRFQDTVRLTAGDRRRLLDRMDQHARTDPGAVHDDDRRANRRHTYRPPAVAIEVTHPGGGSARYLVGARNLSQQGIGLIHGGFLYDRAGCVVVLETRRGELLALPGAIAACRHVDGTIHEIGVRFEREIDLETYFQLVEPVELAPGSAQARQDERRRHRPALTGQLLYIDPSFAARDQVQRYVSDQDLSVTTTPHLGDGLDAIKRGSFSVVVLEADLDGVRTADAVTKIAEAGHTGPIAVVTGSPDQERDARLQELGVREIAIKPLSRPRMLDLLSRCLAPTGEDGDDGYASAIQGHVDSMQRRIEALEESLLREDLPSLRLACESLAQAGPDGHTTLSAAADDALRTMQQTGSTHAAMEAVRRVAELAQSIQSQ